MRDVTKPSTRLNFRLGSLLLWVVFSAVACGTRPRGEVVQINTVGSASAGAVTAVNPNAVLRLGGQWTLKSLPISSAMLLAVPLNFSNGQASGSDGCNQIGVRYQGGERGSMQFDTNTMTTTRMACQAAAIQTFSSDYTKLFGQVRAYQITGNTLSLLDGNARTLALYEAHSSSSITGSQWQIVAYNNGRQGVANVGGQTAMRINFAANGNVGVYTGCNSSVGRYTADGVTGQMTVSNLVNSKKICPRATMLPENAILAALPRVSNYRQTTAGAELRDEAGNIQLLLQSVR